MAGADGAALNQSRELTPWSYESEPADTRFYRHVTLRARDTLETWEDRRAITVVPVPVSDSNQEMIQTSEIMFYRLDMIPDLHPVTKMRSWS